MCTMVHREMCSINTPVGNAKCTTLFCCYTEIVLSCMLYQTLNFVYHYTPTRQYTPQFHQLHCCLVLFVNIIFCRQTNDFVLNILQGRQDTNKKCHLWL